MRAPAPPKRRSRGPADAASRASGSCPGAGERVRALYRAGGGCCSRAPALVALALLAVVGLGVFAYLVAHRYGTPFVVASKLGLGGLVFLLGRSAVVAVHELAHGLAMASSGRRVERAGFKLLLVFPYAFVDTSQAWFEPRRRRIAISAAGPASDVTLGAVFSIGCLLLRRRRGARHLLPARVRRLPRGLLQPQPVPRPRRLPHPRRRTARAEPAPPRARAVRAPARGPPADGDSRLLARYSVFAAGWSVIAALFVIAMTLRYRHAFDAAGAAWIVWTVIGAVWVAVFLPVVLVVPPRYRSPSRMMPAELRGQLCSVRRPRVRSIPRRQSATPRVRSSASIFGSQRRVIV